MLITNRRLGFHSTNCIWAGWDSIVRMIFQISAMFLVMFLWNEIDLYFFFSLFGKFTHHDQKPSSLVRTDDDAHWGIQAPTSVEISLLGARVSCFSTIKMM